MLFYLSFCDYANCIHLCIHYFSCHILTMFYHHFVKSNNTKPSNTPKQNSAPTEILWLVKLLSLSFPHFNLMQESWSFTNGNLWSTSLPFLFLLPGLTQEIKHFLCVSHHPSLAKCFTIVLHHWPISVCCSRPQRWADRAAPSTTWPVVCWELVRCRSSN